MQDRVCYTVLNRGRIFSLGLIILLFTTTDRSCADVLQDAIPGTTPQQVIMIDGGGTVTHSAGGLSNAKFHEAIS
jgi:hypothetical protein